MPDFTIRQGTDDRIKMHVLKANGSSFDFTGKTIRFRVQTGGTFIDKTLTVSSGGEPSSTTGMELGQFDINDPDAPLTDTNPESGWVTVNFTPEETRELNPSSYQWEARADGQRRHPLSDGKITITNSIFDD